MKKILFVINTLGRAGAETALFALLNSLDQTQYDVSLYVIMAQGEMIPSLPPYVHLLNPTYNTESVLSKQGRKAMVKTVLGAWFRNGHVIRKTGYLAARLREMKKRKRMQTDKLLWRMMSDGSIRFDQTFDLAVAYLEGASTYYVADYVKAKKKAAFVHIDYESSGYTREMDRDCYERMDRIFTVSAEVKEHFLKVYPQYRDKTMVFHNMIDRKRILRMAEEPGGFTDHWDGTRLLTVGRLTPQKAYDIAVKAMRLIKDAGYRVRWYVLGEGSERAKLEKEIEALGLQKEFILLGATENPFPYYKQADIYVHATRFEGKSIAIQEAQILGCPVIASDCNGNREQIQNGEDGLLCSLNPQAIADCITGLIGEPEKQKRFVEAAKKKQEDHREDLELLLEMTK